MLDEADRMLDLGFIDDVKKVMKNPTMSDRSQRQTLMFSATFPDEIQRLAGQYLHEYIFLTVCMRIFHWFYFVFPSIRFSFLQIGILGGACTDVQQTIIEVSRFKKREQLMKLLNEEDPKGKLFIFSFTSRLFFFLKIMH